MYTFIRQDASLEPYNQYSGTREHPVQWIQFLHALDQPDLPGLPLIIPPKIQTLKCDKCSLEFVSPINYRRHFRIHRRSLKDNKESHNTRELLAAFWDKSSLTERKQIVSFDGIMLKKIPGSLVIEALVIALIEPRVWTLPQIYLKAGSKLRDLVQARSSVTSISSQDLFSILDDASEGTFLCTGAAEYVQSFIFDGGGANGLDFINLIACSSFLFELILLKAWVADKDAEALKCQMMLVNEEEAARKRQAKLAQRRKQKKLRHKEHKAKEQLYPCKQDINSTASPEHEESIPSSPSESTASSLGNKPSDPDIFMESVEFESKDSEEQCTDHFGLRQSVDIPHQRVSTSKRESLTDNQSVHSEHYEDIEKSNLNSDSPLQNKSNCNYKVMIGSISIPLNSYHTTQQGINAKYEAPKEIIKAGDNLLKTETEGNNSPSVFTSVSSQADNRTIRNENVPFSFSTATATATAKDFLTQRWKLSISEDHEILRLGENCERISDQSRETEANAAD